MRKRLLYLTFFLSLLGLCTVTVDAKEVTANDVEGNSYVIGTHIFTGNTTLTTSHIMLAAKTIEGNNIEDMIIYYKTPRGSWINGATGESLTIPNTFEIEYLDLKDSIYDIKYNLNGGTATNPNNYTKETETFTLNNPTREGYVFLGWTGSNGDTYELEVKVIKGTAQNLEYSADWGIYGDVNIDGHINTKDTELVRKYISGTETLTDTQKVVADVNLDGIVDDVDLAIIRHHINNETQLPYDSGEEYTITYNLDNGINDDSNYKVYAQVSLPFTLKEPTKEGYTFLGWTGSNGDTPQLKVTIEKGTTGDLEYTANWVMYGDANVDGKVNSVDSTMIVDYLTGLEDTIDLIASDVNLDGDVDEIDAVIILDFSMNFIEKLPYDSGEKNTITYNLDGGINDLKNPKVYSEKIGTTTDVLENPAKEGYIFLGWTGSNGDVPELKVTIPEGTIGNLEYTANWVLCGDVNSDGHINTKDTQLVRKHISGIETLADTQKVVADVNLDGEVDHVDLKILIKYLTDAEGYGITLPYNSGEKYTITYNLDGGINNDNNYRVYAQVSLSLTLEKPTKEGYTFLGWTGSNGDTPELEVTIPKGTTGDLEYTANWIANKDIPVAPILMYNEGLPHIWIINGDLDVLFTADVQGDVAGGELYYKDQNGYTLVDEFTHEVEFEWLGAAIIHPGETKVFVARTYIIYKNTKVYSNYSNEFLIKNENIITYNLHGGAVTKDNPIGYPDRGSNLNIVLNNPTKEGYVFLGWTGSNGDVPQIEVKLPENTTGPLHYVANWGIYGDVNGDGQVNNMDLIDIVQYISGTETLTEVQKIVADLNQDGEIDDIDVDILSKYCVDSVGYQISLPYNSGEKYTITYNLDGGDNDWKNQSIYAQISLPLTLEQPTKEGYTFLGWTGSNGDTPELKVTIPTDTAKNLEYTANWVLCGDVNSDGFVNNADYTRLARYLMRNDNAEINPVNADVNLDGEVDDVDLRILWKNLSGWDIKLPYDSGEKYTIRYNLAGGENDWRNYDVYAQISLPFTLEQPTKEGYTFLGWTGSNGDTPELEVTIEEGTTGDLEYTANWENAE